MLLSQACKDNRTVWAAWWVLWQVRRVWVGLRQQRQVANLCMPMRFRKPDRMRLPFKGRVGLRWQPQQMTQHQ